MLCGECVGRFAVERLRYSDYVGNFATPFSIVLSQNFPRVSHYGIGEVSFETISFEVSEAPRVGFWAAPGAEQYEGH